MQSSLQFIRQTGLPASDAKLFAMKQTIADQVRAFMAAQDEGFTPAKLAEEVAKRQRDLPESMRCKRQNIEQLLERDFRTVRYITALAAAMGTTAEVLAAGKFDPAAPPLANTLGAIDAPGSDIVDMVREDSVRIPLLANCGSMGPGNDVLDADYVVGDMTLSAHWINKQIRPANIQELRFMHAHGESMAPTFSDGDVLLVDAGARDPSSMEGIYVLEVHSKTYIKRVRMRMDGSLEVSSDNANIKTVDVLNGDHEVRVIGRVVWAWNGRKL